MGVGGKAIPPYIDKIENIQSDAEFILLVEKEAAYMRMAVRARPCVAAGAPHARRRRACVGVPVSLTPPLPPPSPRDDPHNRFHHNVLLPRTMSLCGTVRVRVLECPP